VRDLVAFLKDLDSDMPIVGGKFGSWYDLAIPEICQAAGLREREWDEDGAIDDGPTIPVLFLDSTV
jgi:hypothetical protein